MKNVFLITALLFSFNTSSLPIVEEEKSSENIYEFYDCIERRERLAKYC